MHVLVDQCGKISDTHTATVLAFSNGQGFTLLIPAPVKRECIQILRERGKRGTSLYYQLFSVALFLLLGDAFPRRQLITIDDEYTGHGAQIKEQLINLLRHAGHSVEPEQIHVALIHRKGEKNPRAHDRAYAVHRGKEGAGKVVTVGDLLVHFRGK